MIGELNEEQMDALLKQESVGRIACHNKDLIYMVPISYAYDGQYIYVRSLEGTKVSIMRQNPEICFEVDNISDMANWKSVVLWGRFEELKNSDRYNALKVLLQRHLPLSSSVTTHLGHTWPFSETELEEVTGVVYRIGISKKTGRFEYTSDPGPDIN